MIRLWCDLSGRVIIKQRGYWLPVAALAGYGSC